MSSLLFDHASVLRLVEWRWGLKPLTPRDASIDLFNTAHALNFSHPDFMVPTLPDPSAPLIGAPCLQSLPGALVNGTRPSGLWTQLAKLAAQHGFVVKDVA